MNNPAGRLLAFTKKAQSISGRTAGGTAWRQVLSDDGEESLELSSLLERLARVVVLPAAVRREAGLLENVNHDLFLRHIGVWEQILTTRISFDAQWTHFIELLKPEHLYSLEALDDLLSRYRPEPTLPPDFVVEIAVELDDLRQRVEGGDLDDDVREFLLTGLDRMRDALRNYRFSGIPPVIDALESALGAAHLRHGISEKTQASKLGREFWAKLSSIYARLQNEWPAYRVIAGAAVDVLALPSGP